MRPYVHVPDCRRCRSTEPPWTCIRGQAFESLGRWEEALQVYSKYARKYPKDTFFKQACDRVQRQTQQDKRSSPGEECVS